MGSHCIGPIPGTQNATVATGHNLLGLSLGPVTGELVAAQLTGQLSAAFDAQRSIRGGLRKRGLRTLASATRLVTHENVDSNLSECSRFVGNAVGLGGRVCR